jgi:DNA modification methylase
MSWEVLNVDSRDLPLADDSVDLIVTSPPYWGLRSYRDDGEHYDGQVGSEDSPQQFVDELVGMIDTEWRRVLKPVGSLWLNLGDKYANAGTRQGNTGIGGEASAEKRHDYQPLPEGSARTKSLMGLPWRVALALIDRGWILRAEVIWSKPNGLPESVTDRVRRSHEQWFHFTLEPRYFSAVDEIREPYAPATLKRYESDTPTVSAKAAAVANGSLSAMGETSFDANPLGRMPGSVWTIPTEPLLIPDETREALGLVDHFAAFPQEWPRKLIMGWSPSGVCVDCGEGLRPVVEKHTTGHDNGQRAKKHGRSAGMGSIDPEFTKMKAENPDRIIGYECDCSTPGETKPAVVLDPFGGTGTTAGVAHTLGRHGISVDLSADYCRLAEWRIGQSGHFQKSRQRMWADRQATLL